MSEKMLLEGLRIKDNDIVIVRVNHKLSEGEKEKIEKTWSELFKEQGFKNIKVVALHGVKLEVLSKADI